MVLYIALSCMHGDLFSFALSFGSSFRCSTQLSVFSPLLSLFAVLEAPLDVRL